MTAAPVLPDPRPEAIAPAMDGVLRPHGPGRTDAFLPSPAVQNHAANLHRLADGTLACVWFAGSMEGRADIHVRIARLAPGADRWSACEPLSDDPGRSEQNPLLFTAPDGRVLLFHTAQVAGDQDGAVVRWRQSADGGRTFGPTATLHDGAGTFVRQPVVVNGAGAWLLPVFLCRSVPGRRWSGDADTAGLLVSEDAGASWRLSAVPGSVGAVHMNVVPLGGGRMVAFYRDRFAEAVRRSVSTDDGRTWSAPEPIDVPNNNSSIQAVRLASGLIAMVANPVNAEMSADRRASLYDEIDGSAEPAAADGGERRAVWGVPRAPLSLLLSADEGRHFRSVLDLDDGPGTCLSNNSEAMRNREFSYPSIVEGPDGALDVAYTVYRRAIRHVRLAPDHVRDLVAAARP